MYTHTHEVILHKVVLDYKFGFFFSMFFLFFNLGIKPDEYNIQASSLLLIDTGSRSTYFIQL